MKIKLDMNGTLRWFNDADQLHREGGPAVIYPDGSLVWYKDGEPHRDDDKPAIASFTGSKRWMFNGELQSRDHDRPAVVNTLNEDYAAWEWKTAQLCGYGPFEWVMQTTRDGG